MKKLVPLFLLIGVLLVPTAQAAGPSQRVKSLQAKVKTLQKQVKTLKAQLAKVKSDDATTIDGLNGQVTTLKGQASATAILNSGKDTTITTLTTQNAGLVAQVSAQAQGGLSATLAGSPTDLWNAIAAIYGVFPNSPGCGLSKTYYASSPYFSYSFTSFGC